MMARIAGMMTDRPPVAMATAAPTTISDPARILFAATHLPIAAVIFTVHATAGIRFCTHRTSKFSSPRSEEHTSELQSHSDLVCRLLLEKKKIRSRDGERRLRPGIRVA